MNLVTQFRERGRGRAYEPSGGILRWLHSSTPLGRAQRLGEPLGDRKGQALRHANLRLPCVRGGSHGNVHNFNRVTRPSGHKWQHARVGGLDACYDCAAEVRLPKKLRRNLQTGHLDTADWALAEETPMFLTRVGLCLKEVPTVLVQQAGQSVQDSQIQAG